MTDLLSVLEDFEVEYLIVGGVAVGFHAERRYTKDLDVLVGVGSESSSRLLEALMEFGAPVYGLRPEELLQEDFVFFIEQSLGVTTY